MYKNDNCTFCDKVRCPFLTVVTRCYKRPNSLKINVKSLKTQTDADYEQVFIVDKVGHGLASADQALNKYKDINCGDYIMVLDDDDMITDPQFIEKLKVIKDAFSPDVIIWRGTFSSNTKTLPPKNAWWGVRPVKTQIGSFNYCMSYKLYHKYINVCKTGLTGDYDFINRVYHSEDKPVIKWIDEIFVSCQESSNGMAEANDLYSTIRQNGTQRRVIRNR